jgi:hypothetical protein
MSENLDDQLRVIARAKAIFVEAKDAAGVDDAERTRRLVEGSS